MSTLEELEAAVNAVRSTGWRITQEETGEWVAWFDPDWQVDDVRVVLTLDDEPSLNEVAAIKALQLVLEHAPALVKIARAAAEVCGERFGPATDLQGRKPGAPSGTSSLRAALAALDTKEQPS